MLLKEQLSIFFESLVSQEKDFRFPSEDEAASYLREAVSVLENEKTFYRPVSSSGKSGGLLDFTASDAPVILVPDLHARFNFLLKLLKFKPSFSKGKNVLELLNEKQLYVICAGDAWHSEGRCAERWRKSLEEYKNGNILCSGMKEEMRENFMTLFFIMEIKKHFAENFHFLKGNHENILNENADGNYSFYKYALEGEMTRAFIESFYSENVLMLLSRWEKNLPVCAAFPSFCITHAEPLTFYKKRDIISFRNNPELIKAFTWTRNGEAMENSVARLFHELTGKDSSLALWFAGHRPVDGKFFYRQGKSLIQFHNPSQMNVAVVLPEKKFDPVTDIVSVDAG